jgi:hypothetical protein
MTIVADLFFPASAYRNGVPVRVDLRVKEIAIELHEDQWDDNAC